MIKRLIFDIDGTLITGVGFGIAGQLNTKNKKTKNLKIKKK